MTDLTAIRGRAEAGNARAQYELAAHLSAGGRRDEAAHWLRSAAKLGEPDALYTLATQQVGSASGINEAHRLLIAASAKSSAAAKRLLSVLYANEYIANFSWRDAIELTIDAARLGDPVALRDIAMLLCWIDENDARIEAVLRVAAQRDAAAAAVYVRRWLLERGGVDRAFASQLLVHLKQIGYPNAQALNAELNEKDLKENSSTPKSLPGVDWATLNSLLKDWRPIIRESQALAPSVHLIKNVAPPEICECVIAVAAQRLTPSSTVDPRTGKRRRDDYRTSLTACIGPVDQDMTQCAINIALAEIAGTRPENSEFLSVLYYKPGQEYKPHFDWLPVEKTNDSSGQRTKTALLYLNDAYSGGETRFLELDLSIKGAVGDVLAFSNVDEAGNPDMTSRHAGEPVIDGAKWIGSKWFRERKYNF